MSAPPPPPPPMGPPMPPQAAPAAPTSQPGETQPRSRWATVATPADDTSIDWKDAYPLHCLAQLGDAVGLAQLLDETPSADLNARDDDGWTMLHYAAWYGHTAAVALLLGRGGNTSATNLQGATPLHFAAGAGRLEAVRTLLEAGAQRDATNEEKQTPLQLARELKPDGWQEVEALLLAR